MVSLLSLVVDTCTQSKGDNPHYRIGVKPITDWLARFLVFILSFSAQHSLTGLFLTTDTVFSIRFHLSFFFFFYCQRIWDKNKNTTANQYPNYDTSQDTSIAIYIITSHCIPLVLSLRYFALLFPTDCSQLVAIRTRWQTTALSAFKT